LISPPGSLDISIRLSHRKRLGRFSRPLKTYDLKKRELDLNLHVPESGVKTSKNINFKEPTKLFFGTKTYHDFQPPPQPATNHPPNQHFFWAYPTGPCMPAGRPGAAPGGKAGREGLKFCWGM